MSCSRCADVHKKSQKSVAKDYGVAGQTLRRYIAKAADGYVINKSLGIKTVLTAEQENELSKYLQSMQASL